MALILAIQPTGGKTI